MSASGIRAARPTKNDPAASAMKAGIRTQVMRTTTSATPRSATRSYDVASTGCKVCRAYNDFVGLIPNRLVISVSCGVLAGGFAAVAARETQVAHWPPAVHRAPKDSPVLSAEDEMKTFFLPPGYRVELVASEPMIEEPVLVDFDPSGR